MLAALIVPAALMLAAAPAATAEARRLVVATPDPAFGSALRAAFAPRGVEVVDAGQTLRQATDVLEGVPGADPVVWLCEAPGGHALCLRRASRTQVVRQVSMAEPLAPADAAALTLSVQVALLHPEPPAPVAPAVTVAAAPGPHLFPLTLALTTGSRAGPPVSGRRFGLEIAYAPDWLGGHLAAGAAISAGMVRGSRVTFSDIGEPYESPASHADVTLHLFARGRVSLGRLWLHLDAGPARHLLNVVRRTSSLPARGATWSADGAVGLVLSWNRLFVGARLGGSLLLSDRGAELWPRDRFWATEGLLSAGLGFR